MGRSTGRWARAVGAVVAVLLASGGAQALDLRSWDQQLGSGRFVVLAAFGSQAVLDKETQLVWQRTPASTAASWTVARGACENLTVGGRRGWRLPTAPELMSLIDPAVSGEPRLPASHPFVNVGAAGYWATTASSYAAASEAFVVHLDYTQVISADKELTTYRRWCVRGAS